MRKPIVDLAFYDRLHSYLESFVKYLHGADNAHHVFPNPADVGNVRERNYVRGLQLHLPIYSDCFFGGYLYSDSGKVSAQMDAIIASGDAPRFNLFNTQGDGKSFASVGSCIGVVCLKSRIEKAQILDALSNISSIPKLQEDERQATIGVTLPRESVFPYKVIFGLSGSSLKTITRHVREFYNENDEIPLTSRPNIIHILGEGVLIRREENMGGIFLDPETSEEIDVGEFGEPIQSSDAQAFLWTIHALQNNCSFSKYMHVDHRHIMNNYNLYCGRKPLADSLPGSEAEKREALLTMLSHDTKSAQK